MKRSHGLNRSAKPLRRGPLAKRGPRAKAWEQCRAEKVANDVDEEGLIRCEDWKLGLERCHTARQPEDMDLHHGKGRDGNLLTDKRWLYWLTRDCHEKAHENKNRNTRRISEAKRA